MKTVKVTYTVKPEYVQENKKHIDKFVGDLRELNNPGLQYTAHLGEDGKTFVHLATFDNEETQKILLGLESFKTFQKNRDNSGLESDPVIEELSVVASSYSILH